MYFKLRLPGPLISPMVGWGGFREGTGYPLCEDIMTSLWDIIKMGLQPLVYTVNSPLTCKHVHHLLTFASGCCTCCDWQAVITIGVGLPLTTQLALVGENLKNQGNPYPHLGTGILTSYALQINWLRCRTLCLKTSFLSSTNSRCW